MPENFGSEINPHNETLSRKAELKTEFGQLRRDWFEGKGIDVSEMKYSELKQVIKEFYKEVGPVIKETLEKEGQTLEGEISAIAKRELDFHHIAEIREKLDLPKWVSLAETVAFIKTVLDTDSQDLRQKYVEYAAKGISLDDMRNVLAYENDVKPARLDTDIYHQSPERSRSTVEVVSNAVDAVNSVSSAIGRFGVGFYQILSHLRNEKDQIKVITGNDESGYYELDFRIKGGEIQIHLEEASDQSTKGTSIQLFVEDFSKDEAEELVKKHFAYNSVAKVECNGEFVNNLADFGIDQKNKPTVEASISENGYIVKDSGVGMSPQIILEKLLVPKLSGKKPIQEFKNLENINPTYLIEKRTENDAENGRAVVSVGGVTIEDFELEGVNTVKTLVIDLPPFTMLGEERNQVAVDEVTILAMKKLADQVIATKDIGLINSLTPVIVKLQGRSMHRESDNNLVEHLKQKADETLPDNLHYLPNIPGFEKLNISNAALVNPEVKQTNWSSVSEFLKPDLSGDGYFVYVAPFKESVSEEPVIGWRNRIVLDQKIYEKYKGDPTMINLFLKAYGQGHGVEVKKLNDKQEKAAGAQTENREKREYKDFSEFVTENWELMRFSSQEIAKDVLGKLSPEQQKAAELVHKHIIEKFPENYAKYFTDAVLYNQLSELTEESLSNFASLAKSEKLPQVLSDLMIYPIISRESEIKHLKGIAKYDKYDEYNDMKERGVSNTRDDENSAKRREWRNIKYWDRENLLHRGGQIFPGGSQLLQNSDISIVYNEKEMYFVNRNTKEKYFTYKFSEDFKKDYETKHTYSKWDNEDRAPLSLNVGEIDFGGKQLVMLDVALIFDINAGEEFNPKPELGKMRLDLVGKMREPQLNFIPYEKQTKNGNRVLYKYFPDGTYEISQSLNNDIFIVYNKEEVYFVDRDSSHLVKKIDFEGKQLVMFNGALFDIDERKEFNPKPDLGKMRLDLVKKMNWMGSQLNFIPCEKQGAFYKYFSDGTYEIDQMSGKSLRFGAYSSESDNKQLRRFPDGTEKNIDLDDPNQELDDRRNCIWSPSAIEKEEKRKNKERERERETEKKEAPFIFGKRPLLPCYYNEDFEKNKKYLYGFTMPTSLHKYSKEVIPNELELKIIDGSFNVNSLAQIEKELYGYKLTQEEIERSKGRNVWYTRFWLNFGYDKPLDLLQPAASLTVAKAESVRRALESSAVENDQKHRRFLNRIFKYADLSDDAFNSITEILLEVDDIERHVLREDLIAEAEVRLGKYDKETKKWFYRLWMKMANKDWDENQSFEFLGKLSKVFSDKIANLSDAEKDSMYNIFDEARSYGQEYIANGWNMVKYKTPVPVHLIPEKIRPLVEFLRTQENEILAPLHEGIEFERAEEVTLSKLVQAKRLDETRMQKFQGDSSELRAFVEEKTADKKQEHIQREIIHPIYYQSVNNPYLFIRELTQNAHDAVIKEPEIKDKSVSLDIFSREEKEVTLRIQDPVGMRLKDVLNYFLIPGESTKLNDKETIGYFGQGLFTLFRGSKEVVLKTSKGDGVITKLKITPQIDANGTTADLNIAIEQEQGEFKGTVIERTVETEFPTVEAAYIKNAVATFTSLVNADVIKIKLNGSDINESQYKLAAINIPELGEMSIYDAPNNVVTQRGLFVKPIDADYSTKMRDIENLLDRKGYVISIPDQVSLTRSRNEIARKQEVLENIKEYMPLLKLKAYLEIFRQDIIKGHVIQLENLPYDYFYSGYPTEGKIFEDSQKLRKGEPITEMDTYLDRGSLISLLVLLPVVELDNKSWSLAELKKASLANKSPLENESKYEGIPSIIKNMLLEGKKEHERINSARSTEEERGRVVQDFSLRELGQQPNFIREQVQQKIQAYGRMVNIAENFNSLTSEPLSPSPRTTLYNEPSSKAHATQGFGLMGWNLSYWKNWQMYPFEKEAPTDRELNEFLDVWSHERAHVFEKSGDFSHNQSFYRKQAEALAKLMYRGNR